MLYRTKTRLSSIGRCSQQWARDLAGRLAPATVAKAVNVLSLILAAAVRSS
jgi:hypothetical protein